MMLFGSGVWVVDVAPYEEDEILLAYGIYTHGSHEVPVSMIVGMS